MNSDLLLRTMVLLVVLFAIGLLWISSRRTLPPAHRFLLDYTLSIFVATYGIGAVVLYLFRIEYLFRYFHSAMFFPTYASFGLVLALGLLPVAVVPALVRFGLSLRGRQPARSSRRSPITAETRSAALLVVLIPCLALVAPIAPQLLANSVFDLAATSDSASLYLQRAEVFESISSLAGGIIYSVLPSIAALLLFWGDRRPHVMVAGIAIAILATLLNLGLFQIGPTLSFLLTCVFCFFVRRGGRVKLASAGIAAIIVVGVLTAYSSVKVTGSELSGPEIFVMRAPLPLPYLIQFAGEKSVLEGSSRTLALDLGDYMFPEMKTAQRFVAMPQPAYIDAWFSYGVGAGLLVLCLVAAAIVFLGNRLQESGFGQQGDNSRLMLWSTLSAPMLYYAFQVDIVSLFISSYGLPYVALPVAMVFFVHHLAPRAHAAPPTRGSLPKER